MCIVYYRFGCYDYILDCYKVRREVGFFYERDCYFDVIFFEYILLEYSFRIRRGIRLS